MDLLIKELHDRIAPAPGRITFLQQEIQKLQKQPLAWQTALDLLSDANPNVRFYGALTLTIKINTDW